MPRVPDVKPTPHLGVPIEGKQIVADFIVVAPNPVIPAVVNTLCAPMLLAVIESLLVADDQVALNEAIG
jgi:hypothetical protein